MGYSTVQFPQIPSWYFLLSSCSWCLQWHSTVYIQFDVKQELTIHAESIESTKFDSLKSCWKLKEIKVVDDDDSSTDTASTTTVGKDFQQPDRGLNKQNQQIIRCDVNFQVELTVSDPIIVSVLDQVLSEVAGRQVSAFDQRCKELPIPYDLIEIANKYY